MSLQGSEETNAKQRQRILVVDDEPFNLEILEELLEEKYNVEMAQDGEQCLAAVQSAPPDLILLDVNMPVLNGYETCKQLRANPDTSGIPIIFVSALSRLEERLSGYEAGGDDYISKPFAEDELLVKINLALEEKQALKSLKEQSNEAMNVAFTAMSTAGETGGVLEFTRESFGYRGVNELAEGLLSVLATYELHAVLRICLKDRISHYSGLGKVSTMEQEVLERMHNYGRFIDFSNRTLLNFPKISILLKNMPVQDQPRYGRMKDNLALLAEAAQARIEWLELDLAVQEREVMLKQMLSITKEILHESDQSRRDNGRENERIMSDLIQAVEAVFMQLGLTEEQEQALMSLLMQAEKKSMALYDEGISVEMRVEEMMKLLQGIPEMHDD